ncbi:ankyrin repeat domain-containing protein 50-like isoform X2 [Contarinia nasturtii]|uniref:ankyrin repeat domain-containing protein 50-like isoform X2 n=1 Tax=Contarinia nasturtii TaxID=265458 RepID=UPI0012D43290|nr:ankyrin repeat domain-containing protein 50-like isoform X2 [Contarinia nasturtii]
MKLFIVLIVFLGAVSAGEKETFLKRFRNYLKDVWDDVATITEDAGVVVKFIDSYPLLHAASKGDIEAVEKKLSNKRFHVDFTTPDLTTMLMEASAFGKYDMVKLLIDRGAHVTHSNKYGFTASDYAKKNGHYNIVQLLENKDTEMMQDV